MLSVSKEEQSVSVLAQFVKREDASPSDFKPLLEAVLKVNESN